MKRTEQLVRFAAALPLAVLTAACSTPQPALDQANHSMKLVSLLETQLSEFRRLQAAAEQARLDSLRQQRAALTFIDSAAQLDIAASKSAGDTVREALATKMLSDADGVTTIRARALTATSAYDAKVKTLLSPLLSTIAATTDVQAKMAAMGTELSTDTRFAELNDFAKDIRDNIEANKKKIKDAEDKAAATEAAVKKEAATKP